MSTKQLPWSYIEWAKKELAKRYDNPWTDKATSYWNYLIDIATKKYEKSLTKPTTNATE